MPAGEIHKDDIGIRFLVTVLDENGDAKDISSATTKQFIFQKPSGELLTASASFVNGGTDGQLSYTSVSGDLDEIGLWRLQVYVVYTGGSKKSDVGNFRIYRNLEA
jgi:hypothetical protein